MVNTTRRRILLSTLIFALAGLAGPLLRWTTTGRLDPSVQHLVDQTVETLVPLRYFSPWLVDQDQHFLTGLVTVPGNMFWLAHLGIAAAFFARSKPILLGMYSCLVFILAGKGVVLMDLFFRPNPFEPVSFLGSMLILLLPFLAVHLLLGRGGRAGGHQPSRLGYEFDGRKGWAAGAAAWRALRKRTRTVSRGILLSALFFGLSGLIGPALHFSGLLERPFTWTKEPTPVRDTLEESVYLLWPTQVLGVAEFHHGTFVAALLSIGGNTIWLATFGICAGVFARRWYHLAIAYLAFGLVLKLYHSGWSLEHFDPIPFSLAMLIFQIPFWLTGWLARAPRLDNDKTNVS